MRNETLGIAWCVAAFGVCLAACARDDVSLGDDIIEILPLSARCAANRRIDGDVRVTNQTELEALAGCEEISGDLEIEVYPGTDLRPLASLRAVGGELAIGAPSSDREQLSTLVAEGWLESFAGMESLERVARLTLAHFAASDLSAFSSLRHANAGYASNGASAGQLIIALARNLIDLRGLEQVDGVTALFIEDMPSLESLDGLLIGRQLESLTLLRTPRLKDIGALASIRTIDSISITRTGLEHLYSLSGLERIYETLSIADNPLLADASAVANVDSGSLVLQGHPKLRGTLELQAPTALGAVVVIANNAELEQIDLGREQGSSWCGSFYINGNALLRSIEGPSGCAGALQAEVTNNPSLESMHLQSLARLDELHVRDNARLSNVVHPSLERVYLVDVVNNPQLSVSSLASIPAFERIIEGNAP